ncbi:hypothetical protein WR25_05101 [Diploscapter pachys]|uniref:PAT complex subunit CCDC47 n=1 Tax=Diploscapter pachys TaxID=2018661 RepID=A0A2A2J857_9BILA|nr:hypothetical protein WR25_05101 [Diploscapter pachys]
MGLIKFGFLVLLVVGPILVRGGNVEDNEFAEFEDEEEIIVEQPREPQKKQEVKVEEKPPAKKVDDSDFEDYGVETEEEFEVGGQGKKEEEGQGAPQPLKFADVPAHFRSNWASYQVEAIILVIIVLYLVNYMIGRNVNQTIATNWFENNREILETQFALVGDDGLSEEAKGGHMQRDTDCSFTIWCSGRSAVNHMQVQIRTVKRQDFASRVMALFSPANDRVIFKVELDDGEIDPFVLLFGQKKSTIKQAKEMLDLSTFTQEKKNIVTFNLPNSFALFADQSETIYAMLEPGVANILRKHEKAVEFFHISDQFSGPKPPEGETYTRLPQTNSVIIFSVNISVCDTAESQNELLQLLFYVLEKARKLRLSKEAKAKADRKRKDYEEAFLRTTHQMRQEAAQARREEKTRERKQRLLEEEDPEKQRRLEAFFIR